MVSTSPSTGGKPAIQREHLSFTESDSVLPWLQAVLEVECSALLALEASRARMRFLPGEGGGADPDIGAAIDLLRRAIVELRACVTRSPPSLLALGFVVDDEDLGRGKVPAASSEATHRRC